MSVQNQQTFQTWDTINGGTANDTLNVTIGVSGVYGAQLSGIENMDVLDTTNASNRIELNGLTSLQNLSLAGRGATSAFTVADLGSLPNITLQAMGGSNFIGFNAGALTGASALNLTVNGIRGNTNNAAAGGLTLYRENGQVGTGALETVNLISTGDTSNLGGLTTSGLGVTTLNASGNMNLTVGEIIDTSSTLKTINASAMTASFTVTTLGSSTVTGGSGNDSITTNGGGLNSIVGGAGNDSFNFRSGLAITDTIAGGDGLDTLRVNTAQVNGTTAYTNISGIDNVTLSTALEGSVTLSRVQAGIQSVRLADDGNTSTGTIVFDGTLPSAAYAINIGSNTVGSESATILGGDLTAQVAGTGVADSVSINGFTYQTADLGAEDVFSGQFIFANGVETLTLSTSQTTQGGTVAAVAQTIGAVTFAPTLSSSTTLNISGNNSTTLGVTNANAINASGITTNVAGVVSNLTMAAGSTATTITGSAGADTLIANANLATSIAGGAGNDTITGGIGSDTLRGEAGNDTIIVNGAGNDLIHGGEGNDTVRFTSGQLTQNDTVVGGDGTADVLQYTSFVAADNAAASQSRVSEFERLRMDGAATPSVEVTLSNYVNNAGFDTIQLGTQAAAANGFNFTNASNTLNTISVVAGVAGSHTFDRLVDIGTNTLTVQNATTTVGGASTITALTALDEETITLTASVPTTAGNNDLTIGTLTVADLKTLNITSASDVVITNAIAGTFSLATVDASTATGAVLVDASNTRVAVTMTGNANSTAAIGFTGGAFADSISGGMGADVLVGNGGADTIVSNGGSDLVGAGAGADSVSLTADGVSDQVQQGATDSIAASGTTVTGNFAAGQTITYANGVDTVSGFKAGAAGIGGDVLASTAVNASLLGTTSAAVGNGWLSGTYNAATGIFTVSANGTGTDTLVLQAAGGATTIANNASAVILLGVDADDFVNANFTGAFGTNLTATYAATTWSFNGTAATALAINATVATPNITPATDVSYVGTYAAAAVTVLDFSGIVGGNGTAVTLSAAINTALTSVIGTTGNDNFILADSTLLTRAGGNAAVTTITGGNGVDTLTLTNIAAADADIAAARLVTVENINLTNGTLDVGAVGRVLTLNNPALAVTNASAAAVALVTFAAGTAGSSFTTTSTGVQTIVVNDTATSVTTGAGADVITVNGAIANFATTSISGGTGVDTLNILPGAGASTTFTVDGTRISGINTVAVDLTAVNNGQTLNVTDSTVSALNVAAVAVAQSLTSTVAATGGTFTYSNLHTIAVDSLTFSNAFNGTFAVGAGGLAANTAHTVTFSAAADTVSVTSADLARFVTATALISGGVGADTLTMTTAATAVTDLNSVRSFETINLSGAANALTLADGVGGAGVTTTVSAAAITGAMTLNLTAEADGSYNVVGGSALAGDTITGGTLADTISGGAGTDLIQIRAGANGNDSWTGGAGADDFNLTSAQSVVATSGIITITDFKADGADQIAMDLTVANVGNRASIATIVSADGFDIITSALTNADITTSVSAAAAADVAIIVFNSSTSRGEIWFDADWTTIAGRVQVATIDNITTLGGITSLSAADFIIT